MEGWVVKMTQSIKRCGEIMRTWVWIPSRVQHHMFVIPTREAERQMLESYWLASLTASVSSSLMERPRLKT